MNTLAQVCSVTYFMIVFCTQSIDYHRQNLIYLIYANVNELLSSGRFVSTISYQQAPDGSDAKRVIQSLLKLSLLLDH